MLSWEVPSPSPDADGYVIYYYQTEVGLVMSEKIAGGDVTNYTLGWLTPNTSYTMSIRAYQDILGPASGQITVMTNSSEGTVLIQLVNNLIAYRKEEIA